MATEKEHVAALRQRQKSPEYDKAFIYFYDTYMPKIKDSIKKYMLERGHTFVALDDSIAKKQKVKKPSLETEEAALFSSEDNLTHDIFDQMVFDTFIGLIEQIKSSKGDSVSQMLHRATKEKHDKKYQAAATAVGPSAEVSLTAMIENEDNLEKPNDYSAISFNGNNPVTIYDKNEKASGLNIAIRELPPSKMMILHNRYMLDRTQSEIAKEVGLACNLISKLEKAGIKTLKQKTRLRSFID